MGWWEGEEIRGLVGGRGGKRVGGGEEVRGLVGGGGGKRVGGRGRR